MDEKSIPYSAVVRVKPDVMTEKLDEERVFLDLETSEYFTSNAVGSEVWKALAESPSIESAYERLLATYDVEPEELRRELEGFVGKLVEAGLVELVEEAEG